jgi:CRISPR-associated endonuclease/helicase Cas3
LNEDQADAYPSLLVLSEKGIHQASPQVWQPGRTLEVNELHLGDDDTQTQAKAEWLLKAVADGGCACWMTNTVKRAQRIFAKLLKIAPSDVDLSLLHSQFTLDERQRSEMELADKYGLKGKRPERGIAVGTQVLEQSLDLDFDVMVSDLAPIDLLLQRAGRLHRHARSRPAVHNASRLWVNYELALDGSLKPGSDRMIYAEFVMRQTQQTLAGRRQIHLPADYRVLIEAVYTDQLPGEDNPLYDAWAELQSSQQIDFRQAKERLLPAPSASQSFAVIAATKPEYEEDENSSDWFVAQTRLGERTLNVIPLEREGDWTWVSGAGEKISTSQAASRETQRELLRHNLRVSQRDAIEAIRMDREENPTPLFKKSTLLKDYYPLWLTDGKAQFKLACDALNIMLHPRLGLIIEKEGKSNDTTE